MIYTAIAGLIALLGAAWVAMLYRHNAAMNKLRADDERRRAEFYAAENQQRHRLDVALSDIQQTHREETIYATGPTHLAARDDFANAWSDAAGLHNAKSAADHPSGSAATDSSGVADDQVDRAGLSE